MNNVLSSESLKPESDWRGLYQAALFETDRGKVPGRITQAEGAIVTRIKELFAADPGHITLDEAEVLDDALYALRALRSCLTYGVYAA